MLDKIMSLAPLNWPLLKNPVNWIVLLLMVMIGMLAISLVMASNNEGTTDNG